RMKMGVFQTTAVVEALHRIGAEKKNPVAMSKMLTIGENVQRGLQHFEKLLLELVRRHDGTIDAEAGTWAAPKDPDKLAAFQAEYLQLLNMDAPAYVTAETIALDELWYGAPGQLIDIAENDVRLLRAVGLMSPAPKPKDARIEKPTKRPAKARGYAPALAPATIYCT